MTAIAFALNPLMSGDEALKEMHAQIAASNSGNKATMQAILVVVMSYERICSIARADAAAAGVDYVPHTLAQFQALIDRAEHAAYIAAAPPPAHADPFDEHLADAADDLQGSFDAFIAHNHAEARRLAPAATNAFVTDDEDEDDSDIY